MADRRLCDKEALDDLAAWFREHDPMLDETLPIWVWEFVNLVEEDLIATGRDTSAKNNRNPFFEVPWDAVESV